jgi:hypothetical protein
VSSMMHWKLTSNKQLPLNQLMKAINEWDFTVPLVIKLEKYNEKRSLSQNALSHVWYKVICDYVTRKGYALIDEDTGEQIPFTPDDIKQEVKKQILGVQRLNDRGRIIEKVRSTSKLSTGEMYDYMNKLYHRCLSIGLILPIPEDSQYQKLEDKQNA